MLARQEEECQRMVNNNANNNAARFNPLNNDHVQFQHRNLIDSNTINNIVQNNGMIYGSPRNNDDMLPPAPPPPNVMRSEHYSSNHSFDDTNSNNSTKNKSQKKTWEPNCLQKKKQSSNLNYENKSSNRKERVRQHFRPIYAIYRCSMNLPDRIFSRGAKRASL